MSKATNPAEASVSCGFFNSSSGLERKYDANDFSKLFDGLINDGVFATIGDCFVVKPSPDNDNTVEIGTGKAWFNHTWTINSESLPIGCDGADPNYDRYDAIVLEVNSSSDVLDNSFIYVKGTAATNPAKPVMINDDFVHQHPLCYIKRPRGSSNITQSNIENVVGTSVTPFVTAILQTVSLDTLLGQWTGQLNDFIAEGTKAYEDALDDDRTDFSTSATDAISTFNTNGDNAISDFNDKAAQKYADYETWSSNLRTQMEDLLTEVDGWYEDVDSTIDDYLTSMKDKLSADPASALQLQIDEHEIRSILTNGFSDGKKVISEDGTVITFTSNGRTLTKIFTNEFSTSTSVLTNSNGVELGRLVKTISSDGLTITSEITLL